MIRVVIMDDYGRESTFRLVDMTKLGDKAAEHELVARYHPRLTRWATGRLPIGLRSMRDTGDIVQDALVSALHNLATFEMRDEGSFLSYLARAVVNRITDLHRSRNRRPGRDEWPEDLPADEPSPLDIVLGQERRRWYERGLAAVSEEDQALIFLSFELGYTHSEVAALFGKPSADAARVAIKRAASRLKAAMARSTS